VVPTIQLLWVPAVVALITLAAVGVGTLLAALNVAYRDFRYVMPFLVQLWMFATPTVYMQLAEYAAPPPAAADSHTYGRSIALDTANGDEPNERPVPGYFHTLLNLNPLVGLIASFRAAMLGLPLPWGPLGWSALSAWLMFIGGCLYFRHVENTFADII
jgi:lipopolysaccharide transport system permease protein